MNKPSIKRVRQRLNLDLLKTARAISEAFNNRCDPGTSDLDREQPFYVYAPLGVWRDLEATVSHIDHLDGEKS